MRIAVSGAHAVGKSTLVAELATARPEYDVVDEVYHDLAAEGISFSDPPTVPDFEIQLERSVAVLSSCVNANTLFDRCPVDYIGYISVVGRSNPALLSHWLRESTDALATLDLVVFVPVERPDRITISIDEYPRLRDRVNRALTRILLEDELGLGLNVMAVCGPPAARARQVLQRLR